MTAILLNSDLDKLDKTELIEMIQDLQLEVSILRNPPTEGVSPEESLCVSQLRFLNHIAQNGELSLEEAKKFEIFHKNLRLARGQVVEVTKKKAPTLTVDQLLELANE
jgi:hypothetical protein